MQAAQGDLSEGDEYMPTISKDIGFAIPTTVPEAAEEEAIEKKELFKVLEQIESKVGTNELYGASFTY